MKKRKTKLWKKILVGFMSATMFLGNLSSLTMEAYAAEEGLFDESGDVFDEEFDEGNLISIGEEGNYGVEGVDEESAETPAEVSVSFYGTDGGLIDTYTFESGSMLEFPAVDGDVIWQDEFGNEYTGSTAVISNLSLYAVENRSDADSIDTDEESNDSLTYKVSLDIVDQDGLSIKGYNKVQLPVFDGSLVLNDSENPPVEVDGYEYVKATAFDEDVVAVNADGTGRIVSYSTGYETVEIDSDMVLTLVYNETEFPVELTATVVDEFGDTIDASYIDMPLVGFDEDGILTLDDPENPPIDEVKVRSGLLRSVKYSYVKSSVNGRTIKALRKTVLKNNAGTSYAFTADGESWTVLKEDSNVLFEYTDGKKAVYTYEDANVKVTATLQHANAIPDDAYFAVTPVTVNNGYDVDTYLKALNKKAETPDDVEDFEFTESNTLLYDIAFYTDESMTEEIEPADGMVKTEIEFKNNQLSGDISATEEDSDSLMVNHLEIRPSIMKEAGTVANAEVAVKDIRVESVDADVSVDGESVAFQTDSFSLYAITYPSGSSAQIIIEYDEMPSSIPFGFIYVADHQDQNKHALMYLDQCVKDGNRIIIDNDHYLNYSQNKLTLESGRQYDIELWRAITPARVAEAKTDINKQYDINWFSKVVYTRYEWRDTSEGWREVNVSGETEGILDMYDYQMPSGGELVNGKYTLTIQANKVSVSDAVSIDSVLGEASGYGVIANTYKNVADTQTNFAVKKYIGGDATGADMANNPGTTYIGEIDPSKDRGVQVRINLGESTIYYGGDVVVDPKAVEKDYYDNNGKLVIQDDSGKATVIKTTKAEVDAKVDSLVAGVHIPSGTNLVLPTGGERDNPEYYLDTTMLPAGTIHIDLDSSTGEGYSLYDVWSKSQNVFINKNPDQTLVFHSSKTNITLNEYNICNDGTGTYITSASPASNDDGKNYKLTAIAETMIFDFPQATRMDFGSGVAGAFYAPNASVYWDTACCGWLICDYAEGGDGEWHFIYQNVPDPSGHDDTCTLELTITKHLIDDETEAKADPSLWPDEGFTFKISKYLCDDDEHDVNKDMGVICEADKIPDLPGMVNGEKTITIMRDQADQAISVGKVDFVGSQVWNDPRCHEWKENGVIDHKYMVFMYKVQEQPCNNNNIKIDSKPYYVKFFVNCKEVRNGNGYKYLVWVDGPHVANIVTQANACKPVDVELTNHVNPPDGKGELKIGKWLNGLTEGDPTPVYDIYFELYDASTNKLVATSKPGENRKNGGDYYGKGLYKIQNIPYGRYYIVEKGTDLTGKILKSTYYRVVKPGEALGFENGGILCENPGITGEFVFSPEIDRIELLNEYAGLGYLRIHKMVVNNFSSGEIRDDDASFLNNVWFRLTNQDDGSYIVFKGVVGKAKETKTTANGHNPDGSYNGLTYDVEYNEDAQWTIHNIPAGSYLVEEVGDGHTFTYDEDTNTVRDLYGSDYRRITHYGISVDAEYDTKSKSSYKDNDRNQTAVSNDSFSGENPVTAIVGSKDGSGNLITQTVQVANFYSNPVAPINVAKSYSGWADGTDNDREFQFVLTAKGNTARDSAGRTVSTPMPAERTVTATKEDFVPSFGSIKYDHEGTYYYAIREKIPSGATKLTRPDGSEGYLYDGVIYDSRVIDVEVTVLQEKTSFNKHYSNTGDYQEVFYYLAANVVYKAGDQVVASATVRLKEITNPETTSKLDETEVTWTKNDEYMFSNSKEEFVSISGTKTWDDANDRDGMRKPAEFTLTADGEKVEKEGLTNPVTVTGNGSWSFSDLPKYTNEGQLIEYTVTETPDSNYKTYVNGTETNAITIPAETVSGIRFVNKHIPETINVVITKNWTGDSESVRPSEINVSLWKKQNANDTEGIQVIMDPEINKSGNVWTYTYSNLPKYENNGTLIVYFAKEEPVEFYKTTINGLTINNEYGTLSVNGTKFWDDNKNQDGVRPTSVKIKLSATNANVSREQVVRGNAKAESWDWTFTDLPKYADKNGTLINYVVSEELEEGSGYSIPEGGIVQGTQDPVTGNITGMSITNKHTPGIVSYTVTKTWVDNNDQDGIRPASVSVTLKRTYKNENDESITENVGEAITLDSDNSWTYSWSNLPEKIDGATITYSVEETVPEGYSAEYEVTTGSTTITNTHTPDETEVTVSKVWDDDDNRDAIRPSEIIVVLSGSDGSSKEQTITPDESGNWSYTFTHLPKKSGGQDITYSVSEKTVPDGYTVSYDGLTIKNTHITEKTSVSGSKIWDDDNDRDGLRPESVTIQLLADGAAVTGKTKTITASDSWSFTFDGLNKYKNVNGTATEIVYTVEETGTTYNEETTSYKVTFTKDGRSGVYTVAYGEEGEGAEKHLTITNSYTPETISVPVKKIWADNNDQDGKRTDVTLKLLADNADAKYADGTDVATVELKKSDYTGNTWSYTFTNLPKYSKVKGEDGKAKAIVYTVVETVTPADYEKAESGLTVTNTHNPEKTSVTVNKIWDDASDIFGIRPTQITVTLYKGSGESKTLVKSQSFGGTGNNWTYTFDNLDKYESGKEIEYSVEETAVPLYDAPVIVKDTENANTYNITNKYVPEYITVSGTKTWKDETNFDGSRPTSVTIIVSGAGKTFKKVVTGGDRADTWAWSITTDDEGKKLPKYYNGALATYTVSEETVEGYSVVEAETSNGTVGADGNVTGMNITNKYTPGKTSVTVTKTWDDASDQDAIRPATLEVTLNKTVDGVTSAVETVELGVANAVTVTNGEEVTVNKDIWTYTWTDLATKDHNKPVTYSVNEKIVPTGYVMTQTGNNITNTHTPAVISIKGSKVWSDDDDRDHLRPEAVTINLYKKALEGEDEFVKSTTASSDSNWTWAFENLAKFDHSTEPVVYYVTESPVTGYTTKVNKQTNSAGGVEVSENSVDGIVFTNSYTPAKTDVSGTKTWVDDSNRDGLRPASITIVLYADNEIAKDASGKEISVVLTSGNALENDPNVWTYEFKDLPKYRKGAETKTEIVYTIQETVTWKAADSYTTAYSSDHRSVTNTHKIEETEVKVTKSWNDGSDQDGMRPASVTVGLFAGNAPAKDSEGNDITVVLNSANNWTHTFTGLPKKNGGVDISYSVKEAGVTESGKLVVTKEERTAEYSVAITGDAATGYTITNTYVPEEIEIAGTKKWTDNGNQDGVRPASVTINLYASNAGTDPIRTITVDGNEKDGSGNWMWSFGKLPKYADGQLIVYTVTETPVKEYTTTPEKVEVSGTSNTSIQFINTHEIEKTNIKIKKIWDDADNQDNKRPQKVVIQLLANGTNKGEPVELTGTNWSYEFVGLDKKANGADIVYSISESLVTGYTASYGTEEDGTLTVTNKYNPGKVNVSGIKVWNDANNQDGKRPGEIIVYLLADGTRTGDSYTTSSAKDWKFEFKDLPENKVGSVGKKVVYTVEEASVDGYTPKYDKAEDNEYYITITNTHNVEKMGISGVKIWDDNNNQDGLIKADTSVTIDLYKKIGNADAVYSGISADAKAPEWKWAFTNLPKYEGGQEITYSVVENSDSIPTGYAFDEDASDLVGTTSATGDISGIKIVNKHEPAQIEIGGRKIWDDQDNQDGFRPSEIKVELYSDKSTNSAPVKTVTVKPDDKGVWNWSFGKLPKYDKGELITYTVKESGVTADGKVIFTRGTRAAEYSVEMTPADGKVVENDNTNITIKNSYTPETLNIEGSKWWDDNDDQDGVRPDKITVRLTNKVTNGTQVTEATKANNWTWKFTDLPRYMTVNGETTALAYNVEEVLPDGSVYTLNKSHTKYNADGITTVDGQATTVSGIVFVNSYEPETTEVSGSKTWDDAYDQDGSRPSSITVNLLADGTKIKSAAVSADASGNWNYSFKNLPVYSKVDGVGGHKIVYSVTEDEVVSANGNDKKYETQISGYNITNKYIPETTSISVKKAWSDADNQDGKRPSSVTVNLLANGKPATDAEGKAIIAELNEGNSWSHTFTDLPKYSNKTEIAYSVTEDKVSDYQTLITGDAASGYTVTNSYTPGKTSVGITKIWDDNKNQDGIRPESIKVILAADGKAVKDAELNETNNWTYTFTDLDEYASGKQIVYTVTEDSATIPSGYTLGAPVKLSDNAWSITNSHTPETKPISGRKTWQDGGDQDGVRPESITIRLLADGTEVASKSVTKEDDWTWTFTDLPVKKDGKDIVYTISEDAIPQAEGHEGMYQTSYDGYNVTNTYKPETVDVEGKKTWNDNGDQDGVRPKEITINLRADGSISQTRKITEADGWKWSFTNLPKYKNGKAVTYTIDELDVPGYEKTIAGYDVINTHKPEKVEISVVKRWADGNDQDGLRPDSVSVQLYAGETAIGSPVSLTAPDYAHTFTGLEKYSDGNAIQYSVKEVSVVDKKGNTDTYTVSYTGAGTAALTLTNTHTPETVSLKINKNWLGGKDAATVPEIEFTLEGRTADGTTVYGPENIKVGKPDWTTTVNDLPKFHKGEEIKYYVTENVSGSSYKQTDVNGNALSGAIEATGSPLGVDFYNVPLKSITVKKNWANDSGYHGGSDMVNITLYANGIVVKNAQILKSKDWTYTFDELPVYGASGKAIEYTVKEDSVFENYKAPTYTTEDDTIIITNELTGLSLNIEKQWLADKEANRPDSITVKVLSSVDVKGTAVSVLNRIKKVFGKDSDSWYVYDTVTLTKAEGWKKTINDLPRYVKVGNDVVPVNYALEEIDIPNGYRSVTNVDKDTAVIINTGFTSIAGFKTWDDGSNVAGYRPGSEEFASLIQLYKDGEKLYTGKDSDHFRWLDTTGDTWNFEFFDLPADGDYTIGEIGSVLGYGEPVVDGYTIKNPMKFTELSVTKVWDDEDDAYLTRPSTVSFRLLANGKQAQIAGVNATVKLGNTNKEGYTWKNLPVLDKNGKTITYSVEEISVPEGYTSTVTNNGTAYTVTNRFRPDTTSVSVRKVWDDQSNAANRRPGSIQVALTRNGEDIDTVTLSESNNWSYNWSDLTTILKDGKGTTAKYGVREVTQVLGYTVTVSGEETAFTITNYYRPPQTPPSTPDTPPSTPDTPPTTPDEPGTPTTPDTPSTPERSTTPTQQPYNIPDEPTPLAGLSQVLGARRAAANSVLGARRSPKTGDASNAAAFAAAMASAGAMMGAWFAMRRKKKA